MERRLVRIVIFLFALVFVLLAFGWAGFVVTEGMSAGHAFSATINILSTVGLGEYPARTTAGMVVVVLLQVGALGLVAIAVAAMAQAMVAGALKHYLGRYRMDDRINKLRDQFIIVGFSLTGESLVRDLIAEGQRFVIIEHNPDVITKLEEKGYLYVEGDAANEAVLKQAGIERAKGLFAVLSADSDNLMVVLSAKGLNPNMKVVSKSTREDYVERFRRAGADAAISPQEWASRRMIQSVLRPHLLNLLSNLLDPAISHASLDEVEVPQGSPIAGKTLGESGIRRVSEIVILGIARSNGELVASPGPDSVIQSGDILIGFGKQENFKILEDFIKGAVQAPKG